MKRLLSAASLTIICFQATATPVYHPPGPNLTYGPVSNGQTIMSEISNPAAGAATLKKDGGALRFGVLSSVGVGFEYGEVDNLYDDLDAAADDLSNSFANVANTADASLVNARIDDINDILGDIEDDGYGKVFGSIHIPLMPLVFSADMLGGSLVFDVNASFVARVGAIRDPIQDFDIAQAQNIIDNTTTGTVGDVDIDARDPFNITYDVNNDSSLLLNAARIVEAAVGYSRVVMSGVDGNLFAGVRGKMYQVSLYRDFEKMEDVNDSEEVFSDFGLDDGETSTGVGVDLGMLWVGNHYRIGATVTNVNEPSFDYNDVDPIKLANAALTDPRIAALLANDQTYTMEKQLTIEAALHSQNQNWIINASYDTNPVEGPTGDEYQWATISAAYATDNWILPGVRAGYRVNRAGSEVKYLTGGVTLFKSFNMDVAYGLDKVDVDGNELPRSFMFNIGFELTF